MDFIKYNVVALIALVVAITGCYLPVSRAVAPQFNGVTNYDEVDATAIKIGGSTGSRLGPIVATTCTLLADYSITATTTKDVECAVTGLVSGDYVFAELAASTTLASQYVIKSANASTTDGFATVNLLNLTGGSAVPSATNGFGSSTVIYFMHPRSSVPGL